MSNAAVNPASTSQIGLGLDVTKALGGAVPASRNKSTQTAVDTPEDRSERKAAPKDKGVYIEGLGHINELVEGEHFQASKDAGEGPEMVILFNSVTGANGVRFSQGEVVRASKLCSYWGSDVDNARALAAGELKRLFDMKAIRLVSDLESGRKQIDLTETGQIELANQARLTAERRYQELLEKQQNENPLKDEKKIADKTGNSVDGAGGDETPF